MNNICVIGAGASGLMAALSAAKNGGRVTVLEAKEEAGKKILRTGNGKCNFTNTDMRYDYFNTDSPMFVKDCLKKFSEEDLILYFSRLGLLIKDKNGYLYPYSEQARTIRDILLNELSTYGISVRTNSYVNLLAYENGKYLVSIEGYKDRLCFDKIIMATGGKAGLLKKDRQNGYELLGRLGIPSTPLYPGLTRLNTVSSFSEDVDGVRMDAKVTLVTDGLECGYQYGEVLFRKGGISGICIFILSSLCKKALAAGKKVKLILDFFPDIDELQLKDYLKSRFLLNSEKKAEEYLTGLFPDKINNELIKIYSLNKDLPVQKMDVEFINNMIISMKSFEMVVTDTADFSDAQVTVGGISTDLLTSDCEVKSHPGLFVTGELINVDGPCGGYNLQWAFTTGHIAGEKACY